MGPIVGTYELLLGSYSGASLGDWAVVFVVEGTPEVQAFTDANIVEALETNFGLPVTGKYLELTGGGNAQLLMNPHFNLILDGIEIDRFSLPAGFEMRVPTQVINETYNGSPTRIFEKTATEYNNLPIGIQRNLALLYGPIGREITGADSSFRLNNFRYTGDYSIWSTTLTTEKLGHTVTVSDPNGGLSGRTWTIVDEDQASTPVTPESETDFEIIFDFSAYNGLYYLVGDSIQFGSFQLGGDVVIAGSGGIDFGGTPETIYIADSTGVYTLIPGKRNDTLYTGLDEPDPPTIDVRIPDPFIKTAYLGES